MVKRTRNPRVWSFDHVTGHELAAYNKLHQAWDELRALTEDVVVGEETHGAEVLSEVREAIARAEAALGLVEIRLAHLRNRLVELQQQGTLPS